MMDPMEASLAAADATGPRFAIITEDNISGYLWITTVLCLVYSFLVIFVRWHVKWNLYGLDDYTATLATFLQLGGSISLFLSLNSGLGKAEKLQNPSWVEEAGKTTYVSQIFMLASLSTAKCSIAYLLLRLFTRDLEITRKPWFLCNGTLVLTVVWGVASIIVVCVGCQPSTILRDSNERHCDGQLLRWRIIIGFDIAIETLLILLPILFIWPIQMRRYIKLQVVAAFGLRFPVIGFAAAHLYHISSYITGTDTDTETSKKIVPAIIYLQLELFWALLSATIPTLKAFMRSFNSGFGMEIDLDGYGSASGSHELNYRLKTLSKSNQRYSAMGSKVTTKLQRNNETSGITDGDRIRPDNVVTEASAYRTEPSASIDGGSQEMIINREMGWTVSHENPSIL